jgi:hypothetical protein
MAASYCHFFTIHCLVDSTNNGDSLYGFSPDSQDAACWLLIVVLGWVKLGRVDCHWPLPSQSFLVVGHVGTHDHVFVVSTLFAFAYFEMGRPLWQRGGVVLFCDYSEECSILVAGKFFLSLASFNHHVWYRPNTASSVSPHIIFIAPGLENRD